MSTPPAIRTQARIADRWMGMVRPFDLAVALDLLTWLAGGGSLKAWSEQDTIDVTDPDGVPRYGVKPPTPPTIHRWRRIDPDFNEAYSMAQEDRAAAYADELIDIADNTTGDFKIVTGRDGVQRVDVDHDSVRRAEARIKARSMAMSYLAPHLYRDKVQRVDVTSGGEAIGVDGAAVANAEVADRVLSLLRKAEERQRLAVLPAVVLEPQPADYADFSDASGAEGWGEGGAGGPSAGENEHDGQDPPSVWD